MRRDNPAERMADKTKETWDRFRSKARSKWSQLTDRDLDQYKGRRREDIVGYIGEKTGRGREEIGREVDSISRDTGYRFGP